LAAFRHFRVLKMESDRQEEMLLGLLGAELGWASFSLFVWGTRLKSISRKSFPRAKKEPAMVYGRSRVEGGFLNLWGSIRISRDRPVGQRTKGGKGFSRREGKREEEREEERKRQNTK